MTPARRELLRLLTRRAAGIALFGLFGGGVAGRAVSAEPLRTAGRDPFRLGIASGMPRPDGVVLWTRLAPEPQQPDGGLPPRPATLRWEVAEDEAFARVLRRGDAVALPERAHAVHVDVDGLPPGRRLFYRFIAGDAESPVGRTRTAPAADEDNNRLRLALMSCQHYEQGFYAAHREVAASDIDLVLFVGDYIYESSNARLRLRSHEGPAPHTLAQYRARYATYKADPDLQACHAAHPWLVTWDDHEVENDYAGGPGGVSPSGLDAEAFLHRRTAAYRAYFEHQPVSPRMAPSGPAMPLHAHHRWGRLADLWTLDNRQYRDVQACGARGRAVVPCEGMADAARSMLGAAQERWIAGELAASRRRWKLLAQSTQISTCGIPTATSRRFSTDHWDGYPAARDRLMDAIAGPRVENALCLGGDVHRNVAASLRRRAGDPGSPVVASEFVCTSVTSHGGSPEAVTRMLAANPDLLHARTGESGYAAVEVTRDGARCDFRTAPFPVRSDARLTVQASVVVDAGRAGVRPA